MIQSLEKLEPKLDRILKPNDMLITMGAGNIWRYNEAYISHLSLKMKEEIA